MSASPDPRRWPSTDFFPEQLIKDDGGSGAAAECRLTPLSSGRHQLPCSLDGVADDAMASSSRCRGVGEEQRRRRRRLGQGSDASRRYVPSGIGPVFLLGFSAHLTNLSSRTSYRHSGRGQLPTKRRETPLIKVLTGEAPGTRSPTELRH
jgi:hypothetical protein